MSDTNNNEINTGTTPVTNAAPVANTVPVQPVAPVMPAPVPAPTPVVPVGGMQPQAPVPQVAPVVSSAPVAPVPVAPVMPAPVQAQPVVQAQPQVAPVQPQAVPVQEIPTAPSVEQKQTESVLDKVKSSVEEKGSIFSGSTDNKSSDASLSDLAVPEDPNSSSSKKDATHTNASGEEYLAEKENKKLPIVVLIIFLIILIAVVVYYFIVMTPTKVFDKAIDNIVDTVTGIVDSSKNSKVNTAKLEFKADMSTGAEDTKYLDGMIVKLDADVDIKNLELGINLGNEVGKSTSLDKDEAFNARVYLKDGGVYLSNAELDDKYNGKVVLYEDSDFTSIDYDRLDTIVEIFKRTKDEIVDIITNDQLKRTITVKKVNNQTTIALKANCTLDNAGIEKIYHPIFKKYLNDEKFIKDVSKAVGISEKEVKDEIKRLYEREVSTQHIDVNLYMNLANTQLISLDITVDDYYVKIDNLNGYFYGMAKYKGDGKTFEHPTFQIQFEYDANKGILNGTGFIDIEGQTFLYSNFGYQRKETDGKKTGNKLTINFFNKEVTPEEENDKKFEISKLDFTLDITENAKINILGKKDSVEMTPDIKEGVDESMKRLTHYVNYVFRHLLYTKWSDDKYILEMYDRTVENKVKDALEKGERPITVEDLKAEEEKAQELCEGKAYRYHGTAELTDIYKSFPDMEGSTFNWVCVYSMPKVEKDGKLLPENEVYPLDLERYQKVIDKTISNTQITKKNEGVNVNVLKVTISPTNKELKVGESVKIESAIQPENATKKNLTWKSDNEKVATVDNEGNVQAVGEGTAKITVTSESNVTATATITVTKE